MLSVCRSLALILLTSMLAAATLIEQCAGGGTPGKVNTVKKSLDGVVLFTATIPKESAAGEPVSLSLQLKNLGTGLLVFNDSALDTFVLKVKMKDGTFVPATRYLEDLRAPRNGKQPPLARDVAIELEPGKEAGVTLPLHRFFDLSVDGDYVVSVEARYRVKGTSGKIAIDNLPFTIRHVPFGRITKVK